MGPNLLVLIIDEEAGAGLLWLGHRTAELYHALAMRIDVAFAPEPVEDQHLSVGITAVQRQARTALAARGRVGIPLAGGPYLLIATPQPGWPQAVSVLSLLPALRECL